MIQKVQQFFVDCDVARPPTICKSQLLSFTNRSRFFLNHLVNEAGIADTLARRLAGAAGVLGLLSLTMDLFLILLVLLLVVPLAPPHCIADLPGQFIIVQYVFKHPIVPALHGN